MLDTVSTALNGLRVLELAHERISFAGKILADMGADVIVVEPPEGATTRYYPPFLDDQPGVERSLYWWHYNTSKRSVTLDLKSEQGKTAFLEMVKSADIVLEANDPGHLRALGLDYERLKGVKNDIIVVSMTPFGQNGPGDAALATDLTLLAGAGPVWMCGYDDHSIPPVRGSGNQANHIAGNFAVMSALTAVLVRDETGLGQFCDVNMHAAANITTEYATYGWLIAQETVKRQTGRHASSKPSMDSQIQCADGRWVNTGVPPRSPEEFGRLHDWILELGFVDDFPEVFLLEMGMQKAFIDLSLIGIDDEITAIFAAGRDAMNLIASKLDAYRFFYDAQSRGIAVGIIYSPEEVLDDPHFIDRNFSVEVEHEEIGKEFRYPGAPYLFKKTPWRISHRAPALGEHNKEVFSELGINTKE